MLRRVKDPRVQGVTLIGVDVSPDLALARVYYSVLGNEETRAEVAMGLESARGFVKRELGKRLKLRRTPDVIFLLDTSLEHGSRIQQILKELKNSEEA